MRRDLPASEIAEENLMGVGGGIRTPPPHAHEARLFVWRQDSCRLRDFRQVAHDERDLRFAVVGHRIDGPGPFDERHVQF